MIKPEDVLILVEEKYRLVAIKACQNGTSGKKEILDLYTLNDSISPICELHLTRKLPYKMVKERGEINWKLKSK